MSEVQKVLDELHRLDNDWKDANSKQDEEISKFGEALSDTREKLEKMEAATDRLEDQMSKAEAEKNLPMRNGSRVSAEEAEHEKNFEAWLRDPTNHTKAGLLRKAVATTTDAAGGYAVPEVISRMIAEKVQDISPMRQFLRVVQVGTSDYKELVDVNGESSGWVAETGTRSETNTPTLAQVAPTMGTLYAYPKATEESLQDMFFNVQDWLVRKTATAFAKAEGAAFISGDGTAKPTGFLNGTPVSIADDGASPERAFGTLQYLPTGVAADFGNQPWESPQGNPGDVLIDAEYALKPAYRQNAVWLMNKGTLKTVRKWRDIDGEYLWNRSLVAGQPSTLNGYAVHEMEDMPAVAANAFPIAFGDFNEGYVAVDRVGLAITIDPYTAPGYVKFYVRRRQGGILKNDDAIKVIKIAAS